jgi:hypothetical protein
VAAAVENATTALAPLPLPIMVYIFSLLPVGCRLRCAEVCRGWRSVLLERTHMVTRLSRVTLFAVVHATTRDGRRAVDNERQPRA